MKRNIWTREETIIAFNVYCKIPFKNCSKNHPLIVRYANLLGRSPSALNMKVGNIGRLDPDLKEKGIVGLVNGAKIEEDIWNEFYGSPDLLAYESEKLIAEMSKSNLEESTMIDISDLPVGKEREQIVKQRINQNFFRNAVLSAYNFKCCITGIGNPEILEACHIVEWSEDINNRTNPKNGLCMNPLFHKAYDKHLIAITPELDIVVSKEMINETVNGSFKDYLVSINGGKISFPDKFLPKRELLELHYSEFRSK